MSKRDAVVTLRQIEGFCQKAAELGQRARGSNSRRIGNTALPPSEQWSWSARRRLGCQVKSWNAMRTSPGGKLSACVIDSSTVTMAWTTRSFGTFSWTCAGSCLSHSGDPA